MTKLQIFERRLNNFNLLVLSIWVFVGVRVKESSSCIALIEVHSTIFYVLKLNLYVALVLVT